ncbi:hypothetical protein [Streptococcus sp. FT1-106]|uniref:hypothetical protein n=1 Tax=Streptococcus sp. FT1-106 TaxID=3409994 RepID=UPI003BF5A941
MTNTDIVRKYEELLAQLEDTVAVLDLTLLGYSKGVTEATISTVSYNLRQLVAQHNQYTLDYRKEK